MSTPLDEYALDFLEPDAKRLVKEMLKAIVEHPKIYTNGFKVSPRQHDGTFVYFLGSHGQPGPFQNNQRLTTNVKDALVFHKIAGAKVDAQLSHGFVSFTEEALEWYRQYGGPDANEIRKRIGRLLRQQLGDLRLAEYQVEQVASEIGVSPEQVREQTHVLLGVGLVEARAKSHNTEFGSLGLTRPAGLLWAESGYPPIQSFGAQTVNVNLDLRVEITNIIEQAQAADLPEDLLLQFEARLKRVQEELEKPEGQGRFQRVRELMEFAASVKELAPLAGGFVAAHGDKIKNLVDVAGNAIS